MTTLALMGKVVLLVALGILTRRLGIITPEAQKGLSSLLLKVVLPCSVIKASQYASSPALNQALLFTTIIVILYYIGATLLFHLFSHRLPIEPDHQKMFTLMVVYANVGFLGFPFLEGLYGEEFILFAVIFNTFYNLMMFSYGVSSVSGESKVNWKRILTDPVNISAVVAIFFFLFAFRLPSFLNETIAMVGGMMVPISMMIIGSTLAYVRPLEILKDPYSYLVSFLRLILIPLVMMGLMKLLHVPNMVGAVVTVMSALPIGSITSILADQYDCAASFTARTVVHSMLFMLITTPLFITLTTIVFPF